MLLATVVAAAGFWAAGNAESRFSGVGVLALLLCWGSGYLTTWRAAPFPPIALLAGVLLGAQAESNDNELAGMNYAAGLLFCEAAILWGALARRAKDTKRAVGEHPERPG